MPPKNIGTAACTLGSALISRHSARVTGGLRRSAQLSSDPSQLLIPMPRRRTMNVVAPIEFTSDSKLALMP